MDFGKVASSDEIDFRLPPDHVDTSRLFASDRSEPVGARRPEVYVGCEKWGRPDWIGHLYPEGTKAAQLLSLYAQHFNCVELNATFHRMPETDRTRVWAGQTTADFRFFPKMYQGVTHRQRLVGAEAATEQFLRGVDGFGPKLGTIFAQLPPNFGPGSASALRSYLAAFPRADYRLAVELRHPDWFGDAAVYDETFAMLHELGVGAVITDTLGRRDVLHQRLTTNEAFIRFVGNDAHESDAARLRSWADRIAYWLQQGLRRVCLFLHHPDKQHSPALVTHFAQLLTERTGVAVRIPVRMQAQPSLFAW